MLVLLELFTAGVNRRNPAGLLEMCKDGISRVSEACIACLAFAPRPEQSLAGDSSRVPQQVASF